MLRFWSIGWCWHCRRFHGQNVSMSERKRAVQPIISTLKRRFLRLEETVHSRMHLCLLCLHFYLLLSFSISSHCSMPTSVNEANLFNTCRSASDSTDLTELKRNRFPRIKHPFCRSMTQPARSATIVLRTQSRRALHFLYSQRQPSLNAARREPTSVSANNLAVILPPNSFVH